MTDSSDLPAGDSSPGDESPVDEVDDSEAGRDASPPRTTVDEVVQGPPVGGEPA